jgi:hypothetical protein
MSVRVAGENAGACYRTVVALSSRRSAVRSEGLAAGETRAGAAAKEGKEAIRGAEPAGPWRGRADRGTTVAAAEERSDPGPEGKRRSDVSPAVAAGRVAVAVGPVVWPQPVANKPQATMSQRVATAGCRRGSGGGNMAVDLLGGEGCRGNDRIGSLPRGGRDV